VENISITNITIFSRNFESISKGIKLVSETLHVSSTRAAIIITQMKKGILPKELRSRGSIKASKNLRTILRELKFI
jgi:single-stranded DNA-specific DHH superfamily exonuclease